MVVLFCGVNPHRPTFLNSAEIPKKNNMGFEKFQTFLFIFACFDLDVGGMRRGTGVRTVGARTKEEHRYRENCGGASRETIKLGPTVKYRTKARQTMFANVLVNRMLASMFVSRMMANMFAHNMLANMLTN